MTIAACYVSPEGVVVAADSTTTTPVIGPAGSAIAPQLHYYEHGQKIFEVGQNSTLCVATWGLGGLRDVSHRTLVAEFGDDLAANPPTTMADVANAWSAKVWAAYSAMAEIQEIAKIASSSDPAKAAKAQVVAKQLSLGYCIAGRFGKSRRAHAFYMVLEPLLAGAPSPVEVKTNNLTWWGAPKIVQRLLVGVDDETVDLLMKSGKWTGTLDELRNVLRSGNMGLPVLPIREAADMLYSIVHSTIKVLKFSHLSPICGGPIEVAVVTTDRPFRWIRHKPLDAAIE